MERQVTASGDEPAGRLLEKLRAARQASAPRSEKERRDVLWQVLREELSGKSEDQAEGILDEVRAALVEEARLREHRVMALEAEVARLQSEIATLRRGTTGADVGGSAAALAKMREGLSIITDNEEATVDSAGLSAEEDALFRLVQEMLRFALRMELSVLGIKAAIGAAPEGSVIYKGLKSSIRRRFRACLERKEGSLEALRGAFTDNARFLVDLYGAYRASILHGSRSILAAFDPASILEANRGIVGYDYQGAWKTFATKHSDLADLSFDHLWQEFYQEHFRLKLDQEGGSNAPRGDQRLS